MRAKGRVLVTLASTHLWQVPSIAAAQPPAPAPAPSVPVGEARRPGPYIVFFEPGRAEITPHAAAVLDNLVLAFRAIPGFRLAIMGNSDREGSREGNLTISRRRAEQVQAYLLERGIPEQAMTIVAKGDSAPLVKTPANLHHWENRNVQIVAVPVQVGPASTTNWIALRRCNLSHTPLFPMRPL